MTRLFKTHNIRKQTLLNGLWAFAPKSNGDQTSSPIQVTVPSCWESYPEYANYQGVGVYKKSFVGGGNIRVVCKGVSHTANVFLDEQNIAHHYNAYTAFSAVKTNAEHGEHILEIEASNMFSDDSALHIPNDYMSYGGISRSVIVEELPSLFIDWVHAEPYLENNVWNLKISVKINNIDTQKHKAQINASVANSDFAFDIVEVNANESVVVSINKSFANVQTYEFDNPKLYLLSCQLTIDEATFPQDDLIERVGFRTVQVQGKDILVNGKKIIIKGFCRHEDHPQFGCALPLSAMDYDLNQIKDLGANAIRTVHYPNDELFLDLCDEKGIFVWEENHARGLSEENMRNVNFDRQCENCIDEMIAQHFNHPSIIIWGILNECASETEYGKLCYEKQFAQIKALDKSRPLSFASCKHYKDLCLSMVDIVSFNIYPEWYVNADIPVYIDELYAWIQKAGGENKPFLITEIGAGAIFGNRGTNCTKWSEERQANILKAQITAVLEKSYGSGLFIWQYCDVRVSEEWFAQRPRTMNNKGVVDEYRRRKLSYSVVKNLYEKY